MNSSGIQCGKDGGSHLVLSVVDQILDEHEQHQTTDGQNQLTTQLSREVELEAVERHEREQ